MMSLERDYFPCQMELFGVRRKSRVYRKTLRDKALTMVDRPNADYIQWVKRPKYPGACPPISVSKRWLEAQGIKSYPF